MKVLMGHFFVECNTSVKRLCDINDFTYRTGSDLIDMMHVRDIFESNDIEIIPSLYAIGHSQGQMTHRAFEYICGEIIEPLKENDVDGIYLFLHGASNVKDLVGESGEHEILRRIRDLVGPFVPVAVVMDPHGNITEEFTSMVNVLSCYRQSPHTDIKETYQIVAKHLVDLLNNRRNIRPVYQRVPILLGGERCMSTMEPLRSINYKLDEIEKDPRILRACYHIGFVRQDSFLCCAAISVTPADEKYTGYAKARALEVAKYAYSRRHDFTFTGMPVEPEETFSTAYACAEKPLFISDSGDNISAGALGGNTELFRMALENSGDTNKKILFAGIVHREATRDLLLKAPGDSIEVTLGDDHTPQAASVSFSATILSFGEVNENRNGKKGVGKCVLLRVSDNLDLIVLDKQLPYTEVQQLEAAHVDWADYDIILVKLGYLFPDLARISKKHIMSMTFGATYQYTERLPRKKVFRPIYPLDDYDYFSAEEA